MDPGPADAKIAQANFIRAIGAVVPNARIDFQETTFTDELRAVVPNARVDFQQAWSGMADAVTSECSAVVAPSLWEADCSTARTSEAWEGLVGIADNCQTRTPASGTPEWTPRSTCVDPNCPEWTPECVRKVQEDPLPQVLAASCGPEPSSLALQAAHSEQPCQGPQTEPTQMWYTQSAPVAAAEDPYTWYRVAYLGGIELRLQPSYVAGRSGALLPQNEVFAVSAEIVGADGRVYLRLADGRGWAFDDSALLPHDPSVVRGHFATNPNAGTAPEPVAPPCILPPVTSSCDYTLPIQQLEPASSPQAHVNGPQAVLGNPVCSYEGTVLQNEPSSPIPNHSSGSVPPQCSYASQYVILEQSPMQAQVAQPWGQIAHDQTHLHDQSPSNCPPAWIPSVTSDCPPTWEPLVGHSSEDTWESGQWGQHY